MPLYDYECECGKKGEYYTGMDEYQTCECGKKMKRIFTARYTVIGDVDFVTSDITGEPLRVTSRKQLDRLCTEHGVHPLHKGWR